MLSNVIGRQLFKSESILSFFGIRVITPCFCSSVSCPVSYDKFIESKGIMPIHIVTNFGENPIKITATYSGCRLPAADVSKISSLFLCETGVLKGYHDYRQ